jgi:hypothetical protein
MEAKPVTIEQDLTVENCPVWMLEFFEHVMDNRTFKYIKVLWTN